MRHIRYEKIHGFNNLASILSEMILVFWILFCWRKWKHDAWLKEIILNFLNLFKTGEMKTWIEFIWMHGLNFVGEMKTWCMIKRGVLFKNIYLLFCYMNWIYSMKMKMWEPGGETIHVLLSKDWGSNWVDFPFLWSGRSFVFFATKQATCINKGSKSKMREQEN